MTDIPVSELLAHMTTHLNLVTQDKAIMASFRAKHPHLCSLMRTLLDEGDVQKTMPGPLPDLPDITALQCSIFDNWPKGTKVTNYPNRYKLAIRAWTQEARQIDFKTTKPSFQGNVTMTTPKELLKSLPTWQKTTRKHPISAQFAAGMTALAAAFPNCLMGPLVTKGKGDFGTVIHDEQVAVATLDAAGKIIGVELYFTGGPLTMPPFSPFHAGKGKLTGKVTGQSRWSLDPHLIAKKWPT